MTTWIIVIFVILGIGLFGGIIWKLVSDSDDDDENTPSGISTTIDEETDDGGTTPIPDPDPPAGTIVLKDLFSGGAGTLVGHTPDVGSAWILPDGYNTLSLTGSSSVKGSVGSANPCRNQTGNTTSGTITKTSTSFRAYLDDTDVNTVGFFIGDDSNLSIVQFSANSGNISCTVTRFPAIDGGSITPVAVSGDDFYDLIATVEDTQVTISINGTEEVISGLASMSIEASNFILETVANTDANRVVISDLQVEYFVS